MAVSELAVDRRLRHLRPPDAGVCSGRPARSRQGDGEKRQGDKETRRQGERTEGDKPPCLLVSLSPCLLVWIVSLSPCLLVWMGTVGGVGVRAVEFDAGRDHVYHAGYRCHSAL